MLATFPTLRSLDLFVILIPPDSLIGLTVSRPTFPTWHIFRSQLDDFPTSSVGLMSVMHVFPFTIDHNWMITLYYCVSGILLGTYKSLVRHLVAWAGIVGVTLLVSVFDSAQYLRPDFVT